MKRLYTENVYLKQAKARIQCIISDTERIRKLGGLDNKDSFCLVLDQTVFFPEGGGQPCDLGQIDSAKVIYVFEKDETIYHQLAIAPDFKKRTGEEVDCILDWDRRFLNMQRHCGEHILSAAFYDICGGINRGFHMGEDYMTIDISLEMNEDINRLTDEIALSAEWQANQMVWDDLPVSTRYFDTKEEAEKYPMRKTLAIERDIVLVCVGDENKASGCVACCGTHPSTTGQVGLIKIYKWESYKGMYRITFDAGARAFSNFKEQAEVLKVLGQRYSSDYRGLIEKIDAKEQKERNIRQELYDLKKVYLNEQKDEILKAVKTEKPLIREYPFLKPDDLIALSRLLPKDMPNLIALIATDDNTVILLSNGNIDCGKIVKDNAAIWKGKGGGRATNARAVFSSRQDIDCFLSFISKAYAQEGKGKQ
jgi:alanyl-tRNA synthetase